jgi:hypothetical protein
VTNCIFWNNTANGGPEISVGTYNNPTSSLSIAFSDVMGGKALVDVEPGCTLNWGTGMIDSDPLFIDPPWDDFHLTFDSPCRNAGYNAAVVEETDFEGDPRITAGVVDMGADEFYPHLYFVGEVVPG